MSVNSITVVLEPNMHEEEEVRRITAALSMVRGVLHATADPVDDLAAYSAETQVKIDLQKKLFEAVKLT